MSDPSSCPRVAISVFALMVSASFDPAQISRRTVLLRVADA